MQMGVLIRFSLQIQINTPAGANSYLNRAGIPGAQHAAKMGLLAHLTDDDLLTFLGYWENLTAEVTTDYMDTIPTAQTYIQEHLDVAVPTLKLASCLGFEIKVGNPCTTQPCTKLPNCGHDCYHQFLLMKKVGAGWQQWVVDDGTGVKANVIVSLEWSSAALMSMSAGGGM